MTRADFISSLSARLSSIPEQERKKAVEWYSELIFDRMEEGMSEEDAVSGIGNTDEIAEEIISQYRQTAVAVPTAGDDTGSSGAAEKAKSSPDRGVNTALMIFAVVALSPIWLPLAATALSLALAALVLVWCLVITAGALLLSAAAVGVVGLVYGFWALFVINPAYGLLVLGTALIAAGLTLALIPLTAVTVKAAVRFSVWSAKKIDDIIRRKGKDKRK